MNLNMAYEIIALRKERDALRKLIEKHHDAGHYFKMSKAPAICPACEKYGGDVLTPDGFWKSPSDPAADRVNTGD